MLFKFINQPFLHLFDLTLGFPNESKRAVVSVIHFFKIHYKATKTPLNGIRQFHIHPGWRIHCLLHKYSLVADMWEINLDM